MKRTAGILIAWAGYAVGTWGWVLWKRYNISFVQWLNPVTPYVWPEGGAVPSIPDDRVFPGASSADTKPSAAPGKHSTGTPEHRCPPGSRWNQAEGMCVPIK